MARVLVLYGTTDGHTARVSHAMGETLRAMGLEADVIDAARGRPRPDDYDGIVVAASVHAGGYQRPVRRWLEAQAARLADKPTAFVSVCLAVLQNEARVREELATIVNRLLIVTPWRPTMTKLVAGALPYTRYGLFKRWMMRRMVAKAGGDTDTSRDYEYTNWPDLQAFTTEFGRLVQARAV